LIFSFIFPDSFGPFFIWLPRQTIEESPDFKSAFYVTDRIAEPYSNSRA